MTSQAPVRIAALAVTALSIFLLPWFGGGRDQPQLAISQLAVALAFVLLVLSRAEVSPGPGTVALVVTGGAVAASVSTLFTQSIDTSFPLLMRWVWLALAAWSVAALVRFDRSRDLLVFSLIGTCLLQVAFSFFIWGEVGSSSQPHYGTFYSPNHYAGFLAMMAPFFLLPVVTAASTLRSGIWGFLAAFVLAGIVLTGSRGGLGAAVVGVVALMFVRSKRERVGRSLAFTSATLLLAFLLAVGLRAALFPAGQAAATGVVESITQKQPSSQSLTARMYWAESALRTGAQHPLTGAGLGTFPYTILADQRVEAAWSRSPHNQYLEGWADGGIALFVASLGIPVTAFVLWFRNRRTRSEGAGVDWQDAAIAGVIAASAHMVFDSDWQFPAISLVFVVMASMSTGGEAQRVLLPPVVSSLAGGAVAAALVVVVTAQLIAPPLQRTGNATEDAAISARAARLMPYAANPHEWRAARLEASSDSSDAATARDALTRAIARRPIDPGLWWRRAAVLEKIGDVRGAREQFARSQEFAPYAIRGYLVWGEFELRQGDPRRAHALAAEGIKLTEPRLDANRLIGTLSALFVLKGNAENALGESRDALESFRRATVAAPGNARAWEALSAGACAAGLVEEGRQAASNVRIVNKSSGFVSPC